MAQQTFSSGDTAPVVRSKLNNNAGDVTAHHQAHANPHGTSLTQANLEVTQAITVPDGSFVRSLNALTDHVTLSEGPGLRIAKEGQDLTLAADRVSQVYQVATDDALDLTDYYGDLIITVEPLDDKTGENFLPDSVRVHCCTYSGEPYTGAAYYGSAPGVYSVQPYGSPGTTDRIRIYTGNLRTEGGLHLVDIYFENVPEGFALLQLRAERRVG